MRQLRSKSEQNSKQDILLGYFSEVVPQLLRPAKGVLTHPSISASLPGAEYSTHLWDWDTYWTARGLIRFAALTDNPAFAQNVRRHLRGSLLNFLDQQSPDGRVPLMMTDTEIDPFGCLTGGAERNQAKPIMAQIALLAAEDNEDQVWLKTCVEPLMKFLSTWERDYSSSVGLLVWGNDVTIGVDNDPTTFGRPSFSSANLLLNCLYYRDLLALGEILRRQADMERCRCVEIKASQHAELIQKCCWDERDRFFYTVDVQCKDRRAELVPDMFPAGMKMSWSTLHLRTQVFTGFLPMWCGIASRAQGEHLVGSHLENTETFNAHFGVRTLAANEPMFSLAFSSNPSNWLGPVWLLSNYLVWKGLVRYSYHSLAKELAQKTVTLLAADAENTGTLHEYYHPDTGVPLSHGGFLDWNLLVLEMMDAGSQSALAT